MRLVRIFILVSILVVLLVASFSIFQKMRVTIFESTAPIIEVSDFPHGLGTLGGEAKFLLKDLGSGLDQVIVRVYQRQTKVEILRKPLEGKKEATIDIKFGNLEELNLTEGPADLEIKVFDKSFNNNRAEEHFNLLIDKSSPSLEVVSSQHNVRARGSQLVIYRAVDKNLASSGIVIGDKRFQGVPIAQIDPGIKDTDFYGVFFSPSNEDFEADRIPKLYAEDLVGNMAQAGFYYKLLPPKKRSIVRRLSSELIESKLSQIREKLIVKRADERDLILNANFSEIITLGQEQDLKELSEDFEVLRPKQWKDNFSILPGTIHQGYSDLVRFLFNEKQIGELLSTSFQFGLGMGKSVVAFNKGTVVFVKQLDVYGTTVGIDHGLGLISIYGNLDQVVIDPGELVEKGQAIGSIGASGFAESGDLIFEIDLQGRSVDPVEWWDADWYYDHIEGKLNDLRQQLGLPISYRSGSGGFLGES